MHVSEIRIQEIPIAAQAVSVVCTQLTLRANEEAQADSLLHPTTHSTTHCDDIHPVNMTVRMRYRTASFSLLRAIYQGTCSNPVIEFG